MPGWQVIALAPVMKNDGIVDFVLKITEIASLTIADSPTGLPVWQIFMKLSRMMMLSRCKDKRPDSYRNDIVTAAAALMLYSNTTNPLL